MDPGEEADLPEECRAIHMKGSGSGQPDFSDQTFQVASIQVIGIQPGGRAPFRPMGFYRAAMERRRHCPTRLFHTLETLVRVRVSVDINAQAIIVASQQVAPQPAEPEPVFGEWHELLGGLTQLQRLVGVLASQRESKTKRKPQMLSSSSFSGGKFVLFLFILVNVQVLMPNAASSLQPTLLQWIVTSAHCCQH